MLKIGTRFHRRLEPRTSTGESMNDMQVKQVVTDELEFDPAFDAAHLGFFVHDGVVTLTGK